MTDVLAPPVKPKRTELATEQEAREVAEAAREKDWQAPSFVRELFEGSFRLDLVHPYPAMDPADLERYAAEGRSMSLDESVAYALEIPIDDLPGPHAHVGGTAG